MRPASTIYRRRLARQCRRAPAARAAPHPPHRPTFQSKYAAALAALATSADPLTSTEAICLLGTSALVSPLPGATCLATLEAGDVPIDAVITALTAFPTARLSASRGSFLPRASPALVPRPPWRGRFSTRRGFPVTLPPLPVLPPVGLHPMPVIGQNTSNGVAFV